MPLRKPDFVLDTDDDIVEVLGSNVLNGLIPVPEFEVGVGLKFKKQSCTTAGGIKFIKSYLFVLKFC